MNTTDRYAKIREALEMEPTPGPWGIWVEPVRDRHEAIAELTEQVENTDPFVGKLFLLNAGGKCPATTGCGPNSEANAAYIAACDPDTIRELLAERDALAAENERLRQALQAEPAPAARTGGMKVKQLEWEEIHQRRSDEDPTTEVVGYEAGIPGLWWRIDVEASDFSLTFPDYSYRTVATLEAAKAAAQADFERRILSALEPAAPEGQQEAGR